MAKSALFLYNEKHTLLYINTAFLFRCLSWITCHIVAEYIFAYNLCIHSWTNRGEAVCLDGKWNVIYIHKLPKLNSLSYRFHLCLYVCVAKNWGQGRLAWKLKREQLTEHHRSASPINWSSLVTRISLGECHYCIFKANIFRRWKHISELFQGELNNLQAKFSKKFKQRLLKEILIIL